MPPKHSGGSSKFPGGHKVIHRTAQTAFVRVVTPRDGCQVPWFYIFVSVHQSARKRQEATVQASWLYESSQKMIYHMAKAKHFCWNMHQDKTNFLVGVGNQSEHRICFILPPAITFSTEIQLCPSSMWTSLHRLSCASFFSMCMSTLNDPQTSSLPPPVK